MVEGLSQDFVKTIEACFGQMDKNGDGSITLAEAKAYFKSFGGISAQAMFHAVDEDGDSTISLDEFLAFWASVKQRGGYSEEDLTEELSELLEGNAWVEFDMATDTYGGQSLGEKYGRGA